MPAILKRTLLPVVMVLLACSGQAGKDAAAGDSSAASPSAGITITPGNGVDSTVSWTRFSEIIQYQTSQVRAVMQSHALAVSARMKDGRLYRSTEPKLDAVVALVHQADQGGDILIATE
jgi:hypothetical protein